MAAGVREGWRSVAAGAIYYLRSQPEMAIWGLPLPPNAKPYRLATLPKHNVWPWTGFSARADGRSFLLSQTVSERTDIEVMNQKLG